jgi:hypothetical protein
MKIRTLEELQEHLDDDLAWRKKELLELRRFINASSGLELGLYVRASTALAYAHLEGFFKKSSECYLAFVSARRVALLHLSPSLRALTLQRFLDPTTDGDAFSKLQAIVSALDPEADSVGNLRVSSRLSMEIGGNLNFARLSGMLSRLGLPERDFELRKQMLDEGLLKCRNSVAHGRVEKPDTQLVLEWIQMVMEMMNNFRNLVENAAEKRFYLSRAAAADIERA